MRLFPEHLALLKTVYHEFLSDNGKKSFKSIQKYLDRVYYLAWFAYGFLVTLIFVDDPAQIRLHVNYPQIVYQCIKSLKSREGV